MTWGCKPENYPDGCGWSVRAVWVTLGLEEWYCDMCERGGECPTLAPDDDQPDLFGGVA